MSAPEHVLDFAAAMEKAAETAMGAGMPAAEVYHLVGTFIGYAAANHPKSDRNSVKVVIDYVVAAAWHTAETRLGQSRGTVQ